MSTLKALRVKGEAALKAASPSPWTIFETRGGHCGVKDARGRMVVYAEAGLDGYGNGSSKGDAEFVALARNAMPQLLGKIDRLQSENERLNNGLLMLITDMLAGAPISQLKYVATTIREGGILPR